MFSNDDPINSGNPPRKPVWMLRKDYEDFLKSTPDFRCIRSVRGECDCGEACAWNTSIDHILARANGGEDALSNYQILCRRENSRKGARDDNFWLQNFYWDTPPNLSALRTAQREEAFEKMLSYAPFFTRPFSEINRKLYVLAWIVGAGKTMAVPTLAFALNHIIRRDLGQAAPRVRCILVLTKDSALRAQMADDLRGDIVRHGICGNAPRVLELKDGWQFLAIKDGNQPDVVVACTQILWEKNGQLRPDIHEILARFDLIVFDEPHFAESQTLTLVEAARHSLCFGLTGSPIEGTGDLLRNYVLFSTYSYESAVRNDGSLKYITADPDMFEGFMVDFIGSRESRIRRGEEVRQTTDVYEQDYDINIEPSKSVVQEVIRFVADRDREAGLFTNETAKHRLPESIPDLFYDTHALIVADSVESAKMLCKAANDIFERDRSTYPVSMGYQCNVVHGSAKDREAKPMGKDHPWLIAKRNKGRVVPGKSARFLVAVDMVREGVDNPYCGVVGIACKCNSLVDAIQRAIGRQARSPIFIDSEGTHVPPHIQDTIRIITHRAFRNEETLQKALKFICNMEEFMAPLPTVEDLMDGKDLVTEIYVPLEVGLTTQDRIEIARIIGEAKNQGIDVDKNGIIDRFGGPNQKSGELAAKWIDKVLNEPDKAFRNIAPSKDLRVRQIVERELPLCSPNNETLERFITVHYPNLVKLLGRLDTDVRDALVALYYEHVNKFNVGVLTTGRTLSKLRKEFGMVVKNTLGRAFEGDHGIIYAMTGSAMQQILGLGKGSLRDGSEWDTPQVIALLTKPAVRDEILGWVRRRLIEKGFCPSLNVVFNVQPYDDDQNGVEDVIA